MKSSASTFIFLSCFSLLFLAGGRAFAIDNYVPLTPIQYTFPSGGPQDCEQRKDTLTKLSQTVDKTTKDTPYFNALTAYKKCQTSLPSYLKGLYTMGIILAGFLAVFSIVRGGFTLMYTDSILGHSEAKGIILRAIGGVLIVYSSYIFMNLINPQLASDLNLSLTFPRVTVKKGVFDSFIDLGSSRAVEAEIKYSQALDTLLKDLQDENKKGEVVDAKTAKAKAQSAAATIRELNAKISDPARTPAEITELTKTRDALDAERVTLLTKTGVATVVASKALINTQLQNYLHQYDALSGTASNSLRNQIFSDGIDTLSQNRDTATQELSSLGLADFAAKAGEIQATYKTAVQQLCAERNKKFPSSSAFNCANFGN